MLRLTNDLGIDLGTANVLIYAEGKGIVLREPSVVAVDKNTGKVLQVGAAARNMLGRTPGNVVAIRPLRDGVISDYEMTAKMLYHMIRSVSHGLLVKPRAVVCVPSGITEVEERAVYQATMEAAGSISLRNPWRRHWEPRWTCPARTAIWWWTLAAVQRTSPC